MRDLIILLIHLIATLARLMGPGGLRRKVRLIGRPLMRPLDCRN